MDGSDVVLEAELSIHDVDDPNGGGCRKKARRRRRGKGPGAESLLPECRIMALTSLPLPRAVEDGATDGHYVAAGCSDGVIRYVLASSPKEKSLHH